MLIIGPDPFISQSSPDHSPLPRIDFSCYEILGPDICSLICELDPYQICQITEGHNFYSVSIICDFKLSLIPLFSKSHVKFCHQSSNSCVSKPPLRQKSHFLLLGTKIPLKFMFSKKATNIFKIFTVDLTIIKLKSN